MLKNDGRKLVVLHEREIRGVTDLIGYGTTRAVHLATVFDQECPTVPRNRVGMYGLCRDGRQDGISPSRAIRHRVNEAQRRNAIVC